MKYLEDTYCQTNAPLKTNVPHFQDVFLASATAMITIYLKIKFVVKFLKRFLNLFVDLKIN